MFNLIKFGASSSISCRFGPPARSCYHDAGRRVLDCNGDCRRHSASRTRAFGCACRISVHWARPSPGMHTADYRAL